MSHIGKVDPLPHLEAAARALPAGGLPTAAFAALDRAMDAAIGHKLFPVLRFHADSRESERVYTNQPDSYPVGGRKKLNPTFWAGHVIKGRQPYIGHTAEDIRSVFFDHALIHSLGCDSVLNMPVLWDGQILGTINLLHEAHFYGLGDLPLAGLFAGLAVPAYLAIRS